MDARSPLSSRWSSEGGIALKAAAREGGGTHVARPTRSGAGCGRSSRRFFARPGGAAERPGPFPAPFVALDRAFRQQAGRLAGAAGNADTELAAFSPYELTEACISCHAQYAPHRLPALSAPSVQHRH